jgi:hypothetical protein
MKVSLSEMIQRAKVDVNMTDTVAFDLMKMLCERCKYDTKDKVWGRLSKTSLLRDYGIYERVVYDTELRCWTYCAGQSYPDEIRTIRRLILNK